MGVDVRVTNNVEDVISATRLAIAEGLGEVGDVAEAYAKTYVPVDTGRLRDSITHVVDGETLTLSADTEYAYFVEMGTVHQGAQPYLFPAIEGHGPEYIKIIRDAIARI